MISMSRVAKSHRLAVCRDCGSMVPIWVRKCPYCGVERPVPPSRKSWIPALAVLLSLSVLGSVLFSTAFFRLRRIHPIRWDTLVLAEQLPALDKSKGELLENSEDSLMLNLVHVSEDQYQSYVASCREFGYSLATEQNTTDFSACTAEGSRLSLYYMPRERELDIRLEAPPEMEPILWPTGQLGTLLPVPESTMGKIIRETETYFEFYVGNTPKDAYNAYVNACIAAGFSVDFEKNDGFFWAKNSRGYDLQINYDGNQVMYVTLSLPEESVDWNDTGYVSTGAEDSPVPVSEEIRPVFEDVMNAYESFFTEYCSLAEAGQADPTDTELQEAFSSMQAEAEAQSEAFHAWREEDMSPEELDRYLEVSENVSQMLLGLST